VEFNVLFNEGLKEVEAVVVAVLPSEFDVVALGTDCLTKSLTAEILDELVVRSLINKTMWHMAGSLDTDGTIVLLSLFGFVGEVSFHRVTTELRVFIRGVGNWGKSRN